MPYCTDEDLLAKAGVDLAAITPPHLALAVGKDGVVPAGTWDLTSATVDFEAQGVSDGRVVVLDASRLAGGSSAREWWAAAVRMMVADAADGDTLTLRNPDMASGVGQPPGSPTVDIGGLVFRVFAFDALIRDAGGRVDSILGAVDTLDDQEASRRRQLCALIVLKGLYFIAWRQTEKDVYKAKLADIMGEIRPFLEREQEESADEDTGGFAIGLIRTPARVDPVSSSFGWRRGHWHR